MSEPRESAGEPINAVVKAMFECSDLRGTSLEEDVSRDCNRFL